MLADSVYRITALARHNAGLQVRDPGHFIGYLIMPMILTLILRPIYVRAIDGGTTQIVTGMLVVFSTLALAIVGTSTLTERSWQTWDRLRSTRASSLELVLGKVIPVFVVLLIQQTILLCFGIVVIGMDPPRSVWLMALAVLVWGATVLAIGTAIAVVVRSFGELSAICDLGAMTLTTLGGAFAPVHMFPEWLQPLAPFSPGYWALAMLAAALRGDVAGTLGPAGLLAALAAVVGAFASWRLTHGWGRATLL